MNGIVLILIKRIAIMYIFIGIGVLLTRLDKINVSGSRSIGNLLITLILPCVILNGFINADPYSNKIHFAISIALAAVILLISIVISALINRKDGIASFAAAFSNPGFFGIPIISAIAGAKSVLYVVPFVAFLNILQSTYGTGVLTGNKQKIRPSLLLSPFFICFAAGMLIYFLRIHIPSIPGTVISSIAELNMPLAMILSGTYIAGTNIKKMLLNGKLYIISLTRLIIIPMITLLLLRQLPASFNSVRTGLLIASACPVGSNVAVYAQLHNKDYDYATQTVVISTFFSLITIPMLVLLSQYIWNT